MGDMADMMLDGTMCAGCGVFINKTCGIPVYCRECEPRKVKTPPPAPNPNKVNCPTCGARVKKVGLADHERMFHALKEPKP